MPAFREESGLAVSNTHLCERGRRTNKQSTSSHGTAIYKSVQEGGDATMG